MGVHLQRSQRTHHINMDQHKLLSRTDKHKYAKSWLRESFRLKRNYGYQTLDQNTEYRILNPHIDLNVAPLDQENIDPTEIEEEHDEEDPTLPNVSLCSWTASVLRDRRRKKNSDSISRNEEFIEDFSQPTTSCLTNLDLLAERQETERRRKIENNRSQLSEKLSTISSAAQVKQSVKKDKTSLEDSPEGLLKLFQRMLQPFFTSD